MLRLLNFDLLGIANFFENGESQVGKVFKSGQSKIFQKMSSTNLTWSILAYFVSGVVTLTFTL